MCSIVADDIVVSLDYTLRLDDGEIIETTTDDGPVEFIQGYGQVLSGLEAKLYGMRVGDEKQLVIEAEDGYGEYDPEAVEVVPRDMFPEDVDLTEGTPLELVDEENDEVIEGTISEIRQDGVVIDLNHPLAGETLYFHVRIMALRRLRRRNWNTGTCTGAKIMSNNRGDAPGWSAVLLRGLFCCV